MHSDFYDNPASEIIRLRDEVSELRRNEDALKKYARMVTELYTELNGKNRELSAQLGKDTNVPSWISVEERLPENCVEVLLYYKKGYVSMGYWDDDLCEWDGMTDEKIVRPDYWMPLPEPPEEG